MFESLPVSASFEHNGAHTGFEVVYFRSRADGLLIEGDTTAAEEDQSWSVRYRIMVGKDWRTQRVEATSLSLEGRRELVATCDGDQWTVNGVARPDLDGCADVDLESSLVTNTLPLHRLDLVPGVTNNVPAAFVRAGDLRVERLEQTYRLTEQNADRYVIAYESPTFDFATDLVYDAAGLILGYPGLGRRQH